MQGRDIQKLIIENDNIWVEWRNFIIKCVRGNKTGKTSPLTIKRPFDN